MRGSWIRGSRIATSGVWVERPGLPEAQRAILWSIFERVRSRLAAQKLMTVPGVFGKLATTVAGSKNPPFHFAVVDESQDIGVANLRFLAALGGDRANSLFFAGDLGQRIFQQPFSWKALGVDIRGRSPTLHVNYRTSHQIRMQADRLLGPEVSDVDGNTEERSHTISVFNGPVPTIQVVDDRPEGSPGTRPSFAHDRQIGAQLRDAEAVQAKELGASERAGHALPANQRGEHSHQAE